MDQKKIGNFLKELRKEKGLTQEQLAESLFVSNRTISRWETGSNLPDLDILIMIAEFYDIEIRYILDGERKEEIMNKDLEETIMKVADYSNDEKKRLTKRMQLFFIAGIVAILMFVLLDEYGLNDKLLTEKLMSFLLGLTLGVLILGLLFTSNSLLKIRAFKLKLFGKK